MADNKILPIALLAGGGYLAYKFFLSPASAPAGATPASPGAPGAAPAPAQPVAAFNTPDQIYQRLVANLTQNLPAFKANPSGFTATPYGFKFYLDQVTQTPSTLDFSQLFPANVNADGSSNTQNPNITLGQFWTAMAPWLSKNVPGMSGLGLAGYILGRRR